MSLVVLELALILDIAFQSTLHLLPCLKVAKEVLGLSPQIQPLPMIQIPLEVPIVVVLVGIDLQAEPLPAAVDKIPVVDIPLDPYAKFADLFYQLAKWAQAVEQF